MRAFAAHAVLYKTPQPISEKEAGGDGRRRRGWTAAAAARFPAKSGGNLAAQLQSYSLDPPEHDGGARFPKNSSEIGNPAKPTKTELSGEFSGESRRFPATNHRSKCSSRQELSNGTKHASNERRMKKLWTIEVLKKFEKNKIERSKQIIFGIYTVKQIIKI